MAEEMAALADSPSGGFSLLCGRYEGVDQRVADHLVDGELSIGDYVLAGGEVAAIVVVEAVSRLLPGVMGNEASAGDESFTSGLLEYPHYTRPAVFRGWEVPDILRNGDHGRIEKWRRAMALRRTLDERPDMIAARGGLSEEEKDLLAAEDLSPDQPDLAARARPRRRRIPRGPGRPLAGLGAARTLAGRGARHRAPGPVDATMSATRLFSRVPAGPIGRPSLGGGSRAWVPPEPLEVDPRRDARHESH